MAKKKTAGAKFENARISLKSSRIICNEIRGKPVGRAKKLLEDLVNEKRSLGGKYYTNTAKKILEILINAEANAKAKNMNGERLFIKLAKADKGRTFVRPRSRSGRRGERAKMTHVEILLEER